MITERARWGNRSRKVETLLLKHSKTYRSRRTGKKVRCVPSFAPVAEEVGVSREFVRQVAGDLDIRSLYRMKGRTRR